MDPDQIPIRDLHLPTEVGWWPLAIGWWLLIGFAVCGMLWLLFRRYVRWRANRARRVALRQLATIANTHVRDRDATATARRLSELLRRALLAYAPRSAVAGLTGERWMAYLDEGLDRPMFVRGPGRALASLPYEHAAAPDTDVNALIEAVRTRLKTPLPGESH